jgi:hypothetical protein
MQQQDRGQLAHRALLNPGDEVLVPSKAESLQHGKDVFSRIDSLLEQHVD